MAAPPCIEIPNWLDVAARSHPDKPALSFAGDRWSFAEMRCAAHSAAANLAAARGDSLGPIGILSANRPGFVFAIHAATRLAVPIVPLNWRQTSEEIAWQLRDANISLLIVDEEHRSLAGAAAAGLQIAFVPLDDLETISDSPGSPAETPPINLAREAAVMYTSGTSGRPKGARITFGNFWFSAAASALHIGHSPEDIWLAAMPLFHIGGLSILYRAVIGALPVILQERFEPESVIAALEDGATLTSVVPLMLHRLLGSVGDAPWPPGVRCVLVGGSAAPPKLIEQCLRRGIPVAPTYGLTETTSQATTLLPVEAISRPSSAGLPLPLTEVRIMTATSPAATGEIGAIEVRGPTLFAGYLDDQEAGMGIPLGGWFPTGDVGYLDDEGYLYVVDRRDDLIISGGENVYPAEIERVLREHPSVVDAGVIGVANEEWGRRPVAAVVWEGNPETASAELRRHCEERLAAYKIPDLFMLQSELPRSPSGKLLRRTLRETMTEDPEKLTQPAN